MFKKILAFLIIMLAIFGIYHKRDSFYELFSKILPQKKGYELVFWTIQLKPVCEKIIQKNINEFEYKHPRIKIVWVDIPIAEAQKRTLASILGDNPPDLINLNPDFSMLLAERGALEFFDPSELEEFHPELVNALKFNDKIFGIPYYATSSVTLYNKKAYDTCTDEPVPQTYNGLAKLAPALKPCQNSVYTVNLNENDTLARILNKYDVSNFNSDEQVENTKEVFSMFKTLYNGGYIPKDSLTITNREVIEKYMAPNTMFVVVGANFIKMVQENAKNVYKDSAVVSQLTGPSGKYDFALMNFIIPKKATHRELAKEFALQLTSFENQLEFAKLTNVLPVNKNALENEYFNVCDPSDLLAQARCESKKQLDNLVSVNFGYKNKKAINDTLNRTLEDYILQNAGTGAIRQMIQEIKTLQE